MNTLFRGLTTVALSLCCSVAVLSAALAHTRVELFSAWSPNETLHSDLHVSDRVKGKCWVQSLALSRADAWRCMAADQIYDPCFLGRPRGHQEVVCPRSPFEHVVTVIKLTQALPAQPGPAVAGLGSSGAPWGLELANGARCISVQGATFTIAGMRANYACNTKGWIIGQPNGSQATWKAFYINSVDDSNATQVDIARAVF